MTQSRILLVEDDQLSREALAYILQVEGYLVDTAQDGKTALDLLHRSSGHCAVLLDLGLPIMNGFDFIDRQKADPRIADIPTVVITAMFQPSVPKAAAVLHKPIDLPKLKSLLHDITQRTPAKKQREVELEELHVRVELIRAVCREICEFSRQLAQDTRLHCMRLSREGLIKNRFHEELEAALDLEPRSPRLEKLAPG